MNFNIQSFMAQVIYLLNTTFYFQSRTFYYNPVFSIYSNILNSFKLFFFQTFICSQLSTLSSPPYKHYAQVLEKLIYKFTYSHRQKDPELIDSYSDDFAYISGNIKRTIIKADHILELAEGGLFCYHRFIYHVSLKLKKKNM